jgi:hypothetical protein
MNPTSKTYNTTNRVARMRVPKMAKNGFNSPSSSRRAEAARKTGTDAKHKNAPKFQKRNKNHFTPI